MTTSLQDIRSRVIRYLLGQSTLEDLHEWFTRESVVLGGHTEDSELRRVVDAVDGLFIQLSQQELVEDEFSQALRDLMRVAQVTFATSTIKARGVVAVNPPHRDPQLALQTNTTPVKVSG